jgi:DNA-directed RNA polymerase specialized sigma24 family protein
VFDDAVARYGPALKRIARAYEPNPHRREDVRQEIHMALWQSLSRFVPALIAFLAIVGTQVIFWTVTYPANQQTNNWTELPHH